MTDDLVVVGVGASAGGLKALKSFLSNFPDELNDNIAFVVIQHLDPDHDSVLDSLLGEVTDMDISIIEDGMKIKSDHVYVTPPNMKIKISNGSFQTSEFDESDTPKLPIDYFFRSLSKDLGEKAISVVLSGTGSDGSTGLKSVKGSGGMTISQKVEEAEYKGMPQNAINTGMVDYILSLEDMPGKILDYVQHPYTESPRQSDIQSDEFYKVIKKIFDIIRKNTGHDFSNYKESTIQRRIGRRMAIHHHETISEYYSYLKDNQSEVENLFKDLLITVTNFFREPKVFKYLKEEVLPELLENRSSDSVVRIWVPGCSTGEEAYTLGMLLTEIIDEKNMNLDIQIFATDLNKESIEFARRGIYPKSIATDVSQERLDRFFVNEGDEYKISDSIRKLVVFAEQNLVKDPPFSRIDLISCRNLLIYLNRELQKKIIPMFHYSLNKDGILVLGVSESIGEFNNLFESMEKEKSIYKRIENPEKDHGRGLGFPSFKEDEVKPTPIESSANKELNIQKLAENLILEKHSHPGVLIDKNYEILYFHGETDKYLSPPKGEPNLSILKMAQGNLRYKLAPIIQKAWKKEDKVTKKDVKVKFNDKQQIIDLIAEPVKEVEDNRDMLMIVFKEKTDSNKLKKFEYESLEENKEVDELENVKSLKQELKSTKKALQSTIDELETSNEKLRSRNEELRATNEELRSTNEELKTSREEAESTNEELTTVNQELEEKIDELSKERDDIRNLLENVEIAIIFVNQDLEVRRFTPETTKIFNLIESDVGRPLNDINSSINYENLNKDLNSVLNTLQKVSKEVRTDSGDWYNMEILPYRTTDNIVDGLVITFKDITKIKRKRLKKLRRLSTVLEDSNDAITVQDLKGEIQEWNKGAEKMYGYSEEEAKNMNIKDIIPNENQEKELNFLRKIKKGNQIESFQTKRITKNEEVLDVWVTVTKLVNEKGEIYSLATTERDITEFNNGKNP